MSQDDQSYSESLALFFDDEMTLGRMAEIFAEVDEAYRACAGVVAPDVDPTTGGPQVIVSSGSLFIELLAVAKPAAWTVTTIVFMKWLVTDGQDIAALPQAMRESYFKAKERAEKAKANVSKVVRRRPYVGDEARRRRKVDPSASVPPSARQSSVSPTPEARSTPPPKPLSAAVSPLLFQGVPGDGGGLEVLRAQIMAVAKFAQDNQRGVSMWAEEVSKAAAFLNRTLRDATPRAPVEALAILGGSVDVMNDLAQRFAVVHDRLHRFAETF